MAGLSVVHCLQADSFKFQYISQLVYVDAEMFSVVFSFDLFSNCVQLKSFVN